MEPEITKEEYQNACLLISKYKLQEKNKKDLSYNGLTKSNIVSKVFNYDLNRVESRKATAYWVSKSGEIPETNPDAVIVMEPNFYTIEGGRVPYETLEEAYKSVIKSFKKKKLIQ